MIWRYYSTWKPTSLKNLHTHVAELIGLEKGSVVVEALSSATMRGLGADPMSNNDVKLTTIAWSIDDGGGDDDDDDGIQQISGQAFTTGKFIPRDQPSKNSTMIV